MRVLHHIRPSRQIHSFKVKRNPYSKRWDRYAPCLISKGYISDLGEIPIGKYVRNGRIRQKICQKCARPSCLHPKPCPNPQQRPLPLLDIYHAVDSLPEVKKSFIGSGVRYDLAMAAAKSDKTAAANRCYLKELITDHVSGRLKVAPEHTSSSVLDVMRKTFFRSFQKIQKEFSMKQTAGMV